MSLNIKNPLTHQLAHQLSSMTGETLTTAITCALQERIERLTPKEQLFEELMQLSKECATILNSGEPLLDHGEYLYDELGLPK